MRKMRPAHALAALTLFLATAGFGRASSPAPDPSLSGQILAPDGSPAVGATVHVSDGSSSLRATTDAEGRFTCPLLRISAARWSVTVVGSAGAGHRLVPGTEVSEPVELRLQTPTTLTGRVVRRNGKPAAHVPIYVRRLLRGAEHPDPKQPALGSLPVLADFVATGSFSVQTDEAGRYRLTGLPRFADAWVDIVPHRLEADFEESLRFGESFVAADNAWFLADPARPAVSLRGEELRELAPLVVLRPGKLLLRAYDLGDRKPLPHLSIGVAPVGRVRQVNATATSPEGWVRLGVAPGRYRVSWQGTATIAEVREERETEVALGGRGGVFRGRVVDEDGRPVSRLEISADFPGKTNPFRIRTLRSAAYHGIRRPEIMTDTDGFFTVPGAPWLADELSLSATRDGAGFAWTGAGQDAAWRTFKLRTDAMTALTGRLVYPGGVPVTGWASLIEWRKSAPRESWADERRTSVKLGADGGFRVPEVLRGKSFSLVVGSVLLALSDGLERPVESPRFTASREGAAEQDVGRLVVHSAHPLPGDAGD
jgi:hypothetical protein